MHDGVETAVFVVVFCGVLTLFLAPRVRLLALVVLLLCFLYYLFQLRVL